MWLNSKDFTKDFYFQGTIMWGHMASQVLIIVKVCLNCLLNAGIRELSAPSFSSCLLITFGNYYCGLST